MLTPEGYMPRIADAKVERMLGTFGAVCVEGPRWCGKTWTAMNHAVSAINVSAGALSMGERAAMEADPSFALRGETPRLIDEWQDWPSLWDRTKIEVDRSRESGRFILTGSSTPATKGVSHSGIGRIGTVRMHPMSLFESGDSTGEVSVARLFEGGAASSEPCDVDLGAMAGLMARGGWPYLVGKDAESVATANADYVSKTAADACKLDGTTRGRSVRKMEMLIRSLARNESTIATDVTLLEDIAEYDDESVSVPTLASYSDALGRLFFTEDQPSFATSIRSPNRVGKSPKRRLADPSLAMAALGLTPEKLLDDPRTYGFMFESLCARDLGIYAEAHGGRLFHYRDERGREVDAVVEMPDGRWGAFEIKTRFNKTDEAAEGLKNVKRYFESRGWPGPSFMCVVCAVAPCAFTRQDGVHVVPVTALGP